MAAAAEAKVSDAQAQITALTLMIVKLRRGLYGRRSERSERLLGQAPHRFKCNATLLATHCSRTALRRATLLCWSVR